MVAGSSGCRGWAAAGQFVVGFVEVLKGNSFWWCIEEFCTGERDGGCKSAKVDTRCLTMMSDGGVAVTKLPASMWMCSC